MLRSHELPELGGCEQVVIFVRLVCDLQLVHHRHDDDPVGVRLRNEVLAKLVDSGRDAMF